MEARDVVAKVDGVAEVVEEGMDLLAVGHRRQEVQEIGDRIWTTALTARETRSSVSGSHPAARAAREEVHRDTLVRVVLLCSLD